MLLLLGGQRDELGASVSYRYVLVAPRLADLVRDGRDSTCVAFLQGFRKCAGLWFVATSYFREATTL